MKGCRNQYTNPLPRISITFGLQNKIQGNRPQQESVAVSYLVRFAWQPEPNAASFQFGSTCEPNQSEAVGNSAFLAGFIIETIGAIWFVFSNFSSWEKLGNILEKLGNRWQTVIF
jgi:hypothetical protein